MENREIYNVWIPAILVLLSMAPVTTAQERDRPPGRAPFELMDGDRVVLLGNTLIEAAQEFGYLEFALTTRWPDRNITFRNIGWAGDTVYGEARGHFTNPPGPYEHLLAHVETARPTVLIVGYGSNAAFQGEEGLPRFRDGLEILLDDLEEATGARMVLLSPAPYEADAAPVPEEVARQHNENLRRVAEIIAGTARARGHWFVDLFSGLHALEQQTRSPVTTNGIHLNDVGYYYMASVVEDALGLPPRAWKVSMDARSVRSTAAGAAISEASVREGGGRLIVQPDYLPVPPPAGLRPEAIPPAYRPVLTVSGLRRGRYGLTVAETLIESASSTQWRDGVVVSRDPAHSHAERLRRLIVEKNRLYFHQYRPQNETYLVGFRAYEQGQNAKELDQFSPLIDEEELEIGRLRRARPQVFELGPTTEL